MNEESSVSTSLYPETLRSVDRAFRAAVREALLDHKQAGNPIAVWRDGKVVIIPPEEIVVTEDWDLETPDPFADEPDPDHR